MSQKRTAAESSNDEQATDGSDSVCQQQDYAKRAEHDSLSCTTLEDLPMELLECILVKVVAMEVKDMKLAKSVWNEKSELVINRLRTVCPQWSNICATKYFLNEVRRTLDGTAPEASRFEMLHQYPMEFSVVSMTSVKDEMFMLCRPNGEDYAINVLDCNNMAKVKDVIPLPRMSPTYITGCSVSNCVYVFNPKLDNSASVDAIIRISKDAELQYKLSPWITDHKLPLRSISVTPNGELLTLSSYNPVAISFVSIYDANGSGRQCLVPSDIFGTKYDSCPTNAIQKSNGNIILVTAASLSRALLVEVDMSMNPVRRYQSRLGEEIALNCLDTFIYGRILISDRQGSFVLLDSEFNRLDITDLRAYQGNIYSDPKSLTESERNELRSFHTSKLHFNRERNEIMCMYSYWFPGTFGLAIFRLV